MDKLNIVLNRIDIKKLDLSKNIIDFSVLFKANNLEDKIEKSMLLSDNVISFAVELIKNIKDKIKSKNSGTIVEFGLKQGGEDVEREKLVKGIIKILDTISRLKGTKDAQQYMKLFYSINNSKVYL